MGTGVNPFEGRENPFDNDIVRSPREVKFSVSGLNDGPLENLIRKFERLEKPPAPRAKPIRAGKAQIVVSPDKGYGKSHLLGRLFAKLEKRATTVYIQPFGDPDRAWQSILHKTVQELTRNDEPGSNQLKRFAISVLAKLGAESLGAHKVEQNSSIAASREILLKLSVDPETADPKREALLEWCTAPEQASGLVRSLYEYGDSGGIDLDRREKAWVLVLGAVAGAKKHSARWNAAIKWLYAEPLEDEEVKIVGLYSSDNDAWADTTPSGISHICSVRFNQLALLASFYRPLLLCFDQTEFYANNKALIKTLGNCIQALVDYVPNHLTVITANSAIWVNDIRPNMESSNQSRVGDEIFLQGLRKEGARELVVKRLELHGFDESAIRWFLSDGWLENAFGVVAEMGVRFFLKKRAVERFRDLSNLTPPVESLDLLFDRHVRIVKEKISLQTYDQDALNWFLNDVGPGLPGISAHRIGDRSYFTLEWTRSDLGVAFAFEGGDHWKRWQSIASEAERLAKKSGKLPLRTYVFRTPDLPKVPKPSWVKAKEALDKANSLGFQIRDLDTDRVCEIHAARALYSDALEGNIDHGGPETLAWLQARFAPFLSEIASLPSKEVKTDGKDTKPKVKVKIVSGLTEAQQQALIAIVRDKKIIDISFVISSLGPGVEKQAVLDAAQACKNLKIYSVSHAVTLLWQSHP